MSGGADRNRDAFLLLDRALFLPKAKLTSAKDHHTHQTSVLTEKMASVSIPARTTAVLLDIEGTTTPITFVKVSCFVYSLNLFVVYDDDYAI